MKRRYNSKKVVESPQAGSTWEPKVNATNVSAIVDPLEARVNPADPDYIPQDKIEFQVAIKNLIANFPIDKIPSIYKYVKDAIRLDKEKSEKEIKMKNKTNEKNLTEEILRKEIRKYLLEAHPGISYHGMDHYGDKYSDEDEEDEKHKKYSTMTDVEGSGFADLAAELGLSVAGAKQLVDKTLNRAKFVGTMDQDELEVLTLVAVKDYVNMLKSSGELTDEDVKLMLDNPDIIRELDGFREHLHKYVRRAHKSYSKEGRLDSLGRVKSHDLEVE